MNVVPVELQDIYEVMAENERVAFLVLQLTYVTMQQAKPDQVIAMREIPSFEEHQAFVESQPFEHWYLIRVGPDPYYVGNISLTSRSEIGIRINDPFWGRGYGTAALAQLRALHPGRLLANINPANTRSIAFFARAGGRHIQNTYELPEEKA